MPPEPTRDEDLRVALERTVAPYVQRGAAAAGEPSSPTGTSGAPEKGAVPSLVVVAGTAQRDSGVVTAGAPGDGRGPTDATLRYDLASLTKVVVTLPAVLGLAADGALDLDAPLKGPFPNAGWFREPSLGDRTARDLLTHTSGLPAWVPFMGIASERRTVVGHALASELPHRHGQVVYSDLGFITLGALVEALTGTRLDRFAHDRVFAPLGIEDGLGFLPLDEPRTAVRVAPTERCGWRGRLLEGEVHDEAAWIMNGVAGHAGAFGTAEALSAYARAWLRRDAVLGDPALLDAAGRRATAPGQPARGLGWVLARDADEPAPEDQDDPDATTVDGRPTRGFGHTGFTGTSLWIDPEAGRFCVLLSNRVHPTRHGGGAINALTRAVHATVFGRPEAATPGPKGDRQDDQGGRS